MRRRSARLLVALRPAGPGLIACLIICQLLAAALIPLGAWATGLVVAQVATPETGLALPLITSLAVFAIALWLGESVLHALWLVQATVARKVDGAVRSEVRLLLGGADHLALVEDPELRDDIAHVMSTGGARGYEDSIGTGTWAQLSRWFDVLNLLAVAAVLTIVSPFFAAAMIGLLLVLRWALQRTWDAETEVEAEGARGLRRTAYWTGLGTGESVAKEVRIFGMGDWVADRRRAEAEGYLRPRWAAHQRLLKQQVVPAAIALLGGALAVGIPAWRAAVGDLSAAQLATALVAGLGLVNLTGSAGGLGRAVAYGHVVLDALDRIRDRLAPAADGPPTSTDGSVELHGVGFAYGDGPPVLRELDLQIAPGEVVAVVGPNGAGKTTLMKLLAGLDRPSAGTLVLPPRESVAVLFSDFVRYPLSLADNVALSAPGAHDHADLDDPGVERALELAGAAGLASRLPGRLQTTLSAQYEGGVDLSGGQWQKVALARAIYGVQHGRQLLIMDEPTAHLDAGQEAEFYDRVVRTLHGTTIVLVSHRLSTVRSADRILLLQDGRITEQGAHDELMRREGTYATMFRLQAERFTRDGGSDPEPGDDLS